MSGPGDTEVGQPYLPRALRRVSAPGNQSLSCVLPLQLNVLLPDVCYSLAGMMVQSLGDVAEMARSYSGTRQNGKPPFQEYWLLKRS